MARYKPSTPPLSDEDILKMDNVPVVDAARYIGKSTSTIYYALQDGTAPYGYASKHEINGEIAYSYSISPGLLVAYKRGTLPIFPMGLLVSMLYDQIQDALSGDKLMRLAIAGADKMLTQQSSA